MSGRVTATFEDRRQAERVRERLITIGVDPADVRLQDERAATGGPGVFDKLAELLAPTVAAKPRWLLEADVEPDLLDTARSALQGGEHWVASEGRLEPRTYVFRETGERLIVEKETIVREEVVLAPRIETRTEQFHDTVRTMDAEVERLEPASSGQNGSMPK
jgi:hypothetical protein